MCGDAGSPCQPISGAIKDEQRSWCGIQELMPRGPPQHSCMSPLWLHLDRVDMGSQQSCTPDTVLWKLQAHAPEWSHNGVERQLPAGLKWQCCQSSLCS